MLPALWIVFGTGGIVALKGRAGWVAAGFVGGFVAWPFIAARPARPQSWWANRFYDGEKNQAAGHHDANTAGAQAQLQRFLNIFAVLVFAFTVAMSVALLVTWL